MNDIAWGLHADAAHRQAFLDGIGDIVVACRDRATPVRVILNSYPLTNGAPGQTEPNPTQQFLQAMSLDAFALATGHLSSFGHQLWAYAMLKNFDLSPIVSSATVGATPPRAVAADNAVISAVSGAPTDFSFTRKDGALPINFGAFQLASLLTWVPYSAQLNQYVLRVLELPAGTYAVDVDGRTLRTWTAAQLGAGVNIGPDIFDPWWPRSPWGAKSLALTGMTDARHELHVQRGLAQGFLAADPKLGTIGSQLNTINQRIIAVQRAVATPYGMRFTVRQVP